MRPVAVGGNASILQFVMSIRRMLSERPDTQIGICRGKHAFAEKKEPKNVVKVDIIIKSKPKWYIGATMLSTLGGRWCTS